jgi:DNA repair exonuclease SbcCD ATPase subunit
MEMGEKKVTFQRLLLRGFGLYRDGIEVYFEPGINNLVTENERGKSTLVAGLIAVIYGLPSKSNPVEFGIACYRNWDHPPRCEGEVEFAVNNDKYLIERDFDTNRVCFYKLGAEGQTIVAEGTHNPMARRPHPDYENKLKEIFGLNSKELFESTFCIIQPLPEMRSLNNEVQKLLSGGGVDFRRVLAVLEDELKDRTRYTGDLGITSRNLQKDKELELLEAEIASLRKCIEEDRQAVDSLEEVQRELREIDNQIQKARQDHQNKRKVLDAWTEWKRLRDNYDSTFREYKTISGSCKEAEKIQLEIDSKLKFLHEEYPEFEGLAKETDKNLEELSLREEKKKEYQEDLQGLKRALQENIEEKEKLKEELKNFPRWQELGADPVGRVRDIRKNAAILTKEWIAFQDKLDEIEKKQGLLETQYSIFQQAQAGELEAVKSYSRKLAELQRAREKASDYFENAKAKRDNYEKVLSAFMEKFQDLKPDIPEEEAVVQKLEALDRENNLYKKIDVLKKKLVPSVGLRLIFTVVLAFVAGAAVGLANPLLLVVGVLAGGLAGYFAAGLITGLINSRTKKELQETERNLFACREEITALNDRIGRFASANPAQLGTLLEKIKQYNEEKLKVEEMFNQLPDAAEINRLEGEFLQAEEGYRSFLNLTFKFTSVFPDLEDAYTSWQKILEAKGHLAADVEAYARDSFGCEAENISRVDPLAEGGRELWKETTSFLQILFPEKELTTVASVIDLLNNNGSVEWGQVEEKARKYDDIVSRSKRLEAAIDMIDSKKLEQEGRLLKLQEEIDTLSEILVVILDRVGGDAQKARERWGARQAVLYDVDIKSSGLHTILSQFQVDTLEKLRDKEMGAEILLKERLGQWRNHIENYPGLPRIEEGSDVEKIAGRIQSLEEETEQIEERVNELQTRLEGVRDRQLQLQKRDLINIAQAEVELVSLEEKKKELMLIRDALVTAHSELSSAIADYQNSYQRHLQELASKYYQKITKNTARKIILDKDFQVQVEEGGRPCEIAQLSKGAQDQLYLALRFAIADLISENLKLPFIFDDPFVSSDSERLGNIQTMLNFAAQERQFAIFSHNSIFSGWGAPVKIMFKTAG